MRKANILLVALLALAVLASCCPRVYEKPVVVEEPPPVVEEPPPPPPPPPEVKEEKVEKKEMVLKPIYFDFNKYNLTSETRDILDWNAQQLKANPGSIIRIEGNCDERGSTDYNMILGERRAAAAKDYLIELGITEDRISIVSNGKEKPKYPGETEDAYAKNRRVDFVIVFQ